MPRNMSVLIVEDDLCILESLSSHLTALGHQVTACQNAREALDALRQQPYQLLVTDAELDGMNGLDLIRQVRKHYPDLGIIMMTAYEGKYPMANALLAGADGFLSKPFSLRTFSMIFERSYWKAVSRPEWWDRNMAENDITAKSATSIPAK